MAATVVLDQQQRNGTSDTGSIVVPPGSRFVNLTSTMSDADALNAAASALVYIRLSYDGGKTYYTDPAWVFSWQGGTNRFGNPSLLRFGISAQPDPRAGSPTFNQPPTNAMATVDTQGHTLNYGILLDAA